MHKIKKSDRVLRSGAVTDPAFARVILKLRQSAAPAKAPYQVCEWEGHVTNINSKIITAKLSSKQGSAEAIFSLPISKLKPASDKRFVKEGSLLTYRYEYNENSRPAIKPGSMKVSLVRFDK